MPLLKYGGGGVGAAGSLPYKETGVAAMQAALRRACPCTCHENRICCLTLQQATLLAGLISVIFSLLIFAHEVALEGGFTLRNYVVLAFCIVWIIVTALLALGTIKRAHFLLLPWMILTCVLMPLFIVGIVAGWKVIAACMKEGNQGACIHEYHLFGTNHHTAASLKLALLLFMFILNSCSFLVVYRYFIYLTSVDTRKRSQDGPILDDHTPSGVRYERFHDDDDIETNMPLCANADDQVDNRESAT